MTGMRIGTVAALLAAALALAGCEGGSSGGAETAAASGTEGAEKSPAVPPLGAPEIRIYLADSTLSYSDDGRGWSIYLAGDGRLEGFSRTEDGAAERARGTWRVDGEGLLCLDWEGPWSGEAGDCSEVYRIGKAYVLVAPGADPLDDDAKRRQRAPGNSFAKET